MTFTNYESKEINCKIIYHGPRGAGKSANLRSVFKNTSKEMQAGLLELEDDNRSTRFFDFLPVSVGHIGDFHLKLHLYTLPQRALYDSLMSVILKGVDGYVFVADSRIECVRSNLESLDELKNLLTEHDYNISDLPRVFQFNKRDCKDTVDVELLRREINPAGFPDFETVATQNQGTLESLQAITEQVIKRFSADVYS